MTDLQLQFISIWYAIRVLERTELREQAQLLKPSRNKISRQLKKVSKAEKKADGTSLLGEAFERLQYTYNVTGVADRARIYTPEELASFPVHTYYEQKILNNPQSFYIEGTL